MDDSDAVEAHDADFGLQVPVPELTVGPYPCVVDEQVNPDALALGEAEDLLWPGWLAQVRCQDLHSDAVI